jgi:hypothetical protein
LKGLYQYGPTESQGVQTLVQIDTDRIAGIERASDGDHCAKDIHKNWSQQENPRHDGGERGVLSQCFDDKGKFALRELLALRTAGLEFGESSVIGRTDSDDSFVVCLWSSLERSVLDGWRKAKDPQILPMEINRSGVQGKVC